MSGSVSPRAQCQGGSAGATLWAECKERSVRKIIQSVGGKKYLAIKLCLKQPRCPSADEWIKKLWYIYTMEYYSAIKNNSFESVLMRWMKLKPIIQSEVSQKDKDQYSILTQIYEI